VRVLIAGSHRATRAGVRLALAQSADCTESEEADEAVATAVRDRPDVVFVDFEPPARTLRTTAAITAGLPGATVIVMSRHINENEFIAAVRAGAAGYLSEGVDPARLPYVMRSLMKGEAVVPRQFVARLIDELRGRETRRRQLDLHEHRRVELTPREWEVVDLLREGASTRTIAEVLGVTPVTVRRHISTVQQKAGTSSRSALIRILSRGEATVPDTGGGTVRTEDETLREEIPAFGPG
jgi:DNA-binding NarL/FixJ family response regulator